MMYQKENAKILLEALPYIQKFNNKIIVVKYGGNAMLTEEMQNFVMQDIVLLSAVGIKIVLVHGGGPEITDMLSKVGKKTEFIQGLRYTDKETVEIASMVLAGKINKTLVSKIHKTKGRAIGFCGADGCMLKAKKKTGQNNVDLGFVGDIIDIDVQPIEMALANNYIPVIASVGIDDFGQLYNINADTVASCIAGTLSAEKLIFMTDIKGLLKDVTDPSSLISRIKLTELKSMMSDGSISGGMIPKIQSCIEGLERGVNGTVIIDGRIPHALLLELFSDKGIGSLFERNSY